jgi:hypothetical protein
VLQGPGFEGFDVSFIDLVEGKISPRTVTEQLPIAVLIKLNCAMLFRQPGILVRKTSRLVNRTCSGEPDDHSFKSAPPMRTLTLDALDSEFCE